MKLTTSGMPDLRYMKVYAGDLTATQLKFSETGDETYRVITGITSKSYTVQNLAEGGTFNFYVVANYVNSAIGTSNTKQVTLLENTNPMITVNPATVDMAAAVGETATATFNVSGANLTGNVTLTLTDANGVYSITPTTISAADAMNGVDVTVTYNPAAFGSHNATITLSSADAENVTVTLNGTATLTKANPVMLPANETYINLTKFRAEWTDATPAANVESYTLEVTPKPTEVPVELIGSVVGTDYSSGTATYSDITLPAPWGGNNLRGANKRAIYFRQQGYQSATLEGKITYTVPEGYDNMTFTVKITTDYDTYGSGNLTVATPQTAAVGHNFSASETYSWLVTASAGEVITITSTQADYSPDITKIEIYTGDATAANLMRIAQEEGDANSRLITGITDKYYTVKNLAEGGTFLYRVKAIYVDGTESDWSNIEEVTLFENGHAYMPGDVNHDDVVDVNDVTMLIAYILGNNDTICPICADVNNDDEIDVSDVTAIINIILGKTASFNVAMPANNYLQSGR